MRRPERYRSRCGFSGREPYRPLLNAMIDRVPHHVDQRVGELVDHPLIELGLLPFDMERDLLVGEHAEVADHALEPLEEGADRHHPRVEHPFLDAVAEPTAAPGGGSVAALAGALGASLGQMVAGLSRKKKSKAAHFDQLSDALSEFQAESRSLAEAIDRDSASFEQVMAAYKLPKETSEEERHRDAAIQTALHGAASVPLEVARRAAEVFDRLGQLEPMSSPSMYSDIRVGRLMAAAAVRGALENVAINLESISDSAFASRLRSESASLAARVAESPVNVGR